MQNLQVDSDAEAERGLVWNARIISGCSRQFEDAASFIPLLIAAVIFGLGLLILQFWFANWQPSFLQGCLSIFVFASAPTVAFRWWIKRHFAPESANLKCILQSDGLQLLPLEGHEESRTIPWQFMRNIKGRRVYQSARAVRLSFRAGHLEKQETIEFVLCADREGYDLFMKALHEKVSIGPLI